MVNQTSRLDAHEQQIQQLQSDVTAIKVSLSVLEAERVESAEFRKMMMAWMKARGKKQTDISLESELPGSVFTFSGPKSGLDSSPNPKSVPDLDFGPKSASDRDAPTGLSSLIDQLEALISRSEERACQLRSVRSKYDNIPASFYAITENSINTPQSDVFSADNMRSISSSSGSDLKSESSGGNFLAQLEALIARSEERWMKHQEKHTGDGSSESEFPDSPSSFTRLPAITSRYEANLFGAGEKLPRSEIPSVQAKLSLSVGNWAIWDNFQWAVGFNTVMGHYVELNSVVDPTYPDSGLGVKQKFVVGLAFSVLDLCGTGKAPFDRGKDPLSHRPLVETRLTFSVMWNFWVMHGQPRPPEDATKPISTLDLEFVG